MSVQEDIELMESREMIVSKANYVVQNGRFKLSALELKTLAYIISLIKPDSKQLEYSFDIRYYCKICGINYNSGQNYEVIKKALKRLSDRSLWLPIDNNEVLCRWLSKVKINKKSSVVSIRLDEDMIPYLFELKQFTAFQLLDVLSLNSKYSMKLYEVLKSYANLKERIFYVDDLQYQLFSNYKNYSDFERRVLVVSENEINERTALTIRHEIIERGRYNKVVRIKFKIITKSKGMREVINERNHNRLGLLTKQLERIDRTDADKLT